MTTTKGQPLAPVNWLLNLLPHDELQVEGDPYMRRYWLLKTRWFQVRLHHILRSDKARHLHSHPWGFVSIGLRGRYIETLRRAGEIRSDRHTYRAPWIIRRRAGDRHRLTLATPVWTLIFTGPVRRDDADRAVWGFDVNGHVVPWWEYADDICPPGVKS